MIKTDKWKPSPNYPDRNVYDGQRTAQEVFDDLEAHLTAIGYIPDEYFLFDDRRWGNGREFPSDGYLTNQVDYGGSEGIYLDISLEYQEKGERKWEHFATGKTLGETGEDMDRMNLIASAVTKAFHEDGFHARYMIVGGTPAPSGVTVHLNPEEREVMAFALTKMREALYTGDPDLNALRCKVPGYPFEISDFENGSGSYITAGQILKRISGESAGQEQTEKGVPTQGVIFSRVRLHMENGAESNFFYVPGIPRGYADIEEYEDYIEFVNITKAATETVSKKVTASVTPLSIGKGAPRDASQADIDRIYHVADDLEDPDCDPQIAFGWFQGEQLEFTFDYDADERLDQGMGGIE